MAGPLEASGDSYRSPLLRVQRVTKAFGGVRALSQVTLQMEAGEIRGLIGPNGAGKTTLFNVISGVYAPEAGELWFNDHSLLGLPPHKVCALGIARTFQVVQPFARMSVLDNVAAAFLFGQGQQSLRQARAEALPFLEFGSLAEVSQRRAATLTLSQRKRLEMVRALATGPRLLLLDEVLAGLNAAETAEMMSLIKGLQKAFGVSILLIEHNVKLVMGLSHRVTVLNYGCIIAEGTPEEVIANAEVIRAYLGDRRQRWAGPC